MSDFGAPSVFPRERETPMSPSVTDQPLRFSEFEICPAERVLRVRGETVPMGGRAFDLLLCLAQRRDRLVTKQELLDLVWPGVIVEEHNIATQIGTLRKVLGRQAITTIPGRGYRLTSRVDDELPLAPAPTLAVQTAAQAKPAPRLTPMLGRDHDQTTLTALLQQERLVSIVGAGGIGKSLLARHLMELPGKRWANGTCWAELTSISDSAMLSVRVAEEVGVRLAGDDPVTALAASVAGLEMLVVLDNAEHLRASVAALAVALLDAAPGVRLLVTSQQPLQVVGERVYRLGPLAIPQQPMPAALALGYASIALFVERARDADAHFEFGDAQATAAIEICRQLDGLPLAIELAAARAPLLGVQRLNLMMRSRLQLLTRNPDSQAPARQQTLRAALEWTHGFLGPSLSKVFRRLGVIVDSASLAFIQRVVADGSGELDEWAVLDALGILIDRSLVVVLPTENAEPRYRLLETPRAFALEQLDSAGEREMMQSRHASVLANFYDTAWPERWSGRISVDRWEASVMLDANNARDAIAWASNAGEARIAASLAATLIMALPRRSQVERLQLCELCESLAERVDSESVRLRALHVAIRPWHHRSQERSVEIAALALELARRLDRDAPDRWGLYLSLCTWVLSAAVSARPRLDALRMAVAEIDRIEDASWPPHRLAEGWDARAIARIPFDDPTRSADMLTFSRNRGKAMQAAGLGGAPWVAVLIDAEIMCGNFHEAVEIGERELARTADRRDEWTLFQLQGNLVLALLALSETGRARPLLMQAWHIAVRFKVQAFISDLPALLAALEGRPRAAAILSGYANAQWTARDQLRQPNEIAALERCRSIVISALGRPSCDALMARGRVLRDDQVSALAFAEEDLG